MNLKYKILIVVVVLAATFAAGRYSVKSKVITQKVVTTEVKHEQEHTQVHQVEVKKPDGTVVVTTDTDTKETAVTDTKQTAQTTVQDNVRKNLNVSLLGEYDFHQHAPDYGLSVSKEILGPMTVGLWGMKSGIVGVSIGLDF